MGFIDFTQAEPEAGKTAPQGFVDFDQPQPDRPDFTRGIKTAFQQVPETLYDLAGITGRPPDLEAVG